MNKGVIVKKSTLSIFLVAGLTFALGLSACSGKSEDSTTEEATPAATEAVEETKEGAYILTSVNSGLPDEDIRATDEYTIDEVGNVLTSKTTVYIEDNEPTVLTESYTYDDEGKLVSITSSTDADKGEPNNYVVKTDEDGKLLSVAEDIEDGAVRTYEYDEDGDLAKMTYEAKGSKTVREYDEDGYLVNVVSDDDYKASLTYTKDENGVPTKATKIVDSALGHEEYEYTFESDENGNITKVTVKTLVSVDENGQEEDLSDTDLVFEFGYTYVENASAGVKTHNMTSLASILSQS